jgi:hypothetical protein
MSELKSRYAQLFAGKFKSNDKKLISEGFEDLQDVADRLSELYDQVYGFEEAMVNMIDDLEVANPENTMYKQLNAQASRYAKAVITNMDGISKIIDKLEKIGSMQDEEI